MTRKSKVFRLFMSLMLIISTLMTGILPVSAADNAFSDVQSGAYYAESVGWAIQQGITKGTSATTFSPDKGCTRAECVTFLYRYAGSPETDPANASMFTDVKSDAYYASAVAWAVETGVTTGTSETTFSPDEKCSRAQIVTFLWRYNDMPEVDNAGMFADVNADAYYAGAVSWAVAQDITKGTAETTFSPDNTCTRAQIVTFLFRMDHFAAPMGGGNSVDVYAITDLDLDDDNELAVAEVSAQENCALLVRFIEEDIYFSEEYPNNKEYIDYGDVYGSHVVAAGTDMEPITVDINYPYDLPEHFVAEAVLIDENGDPLCEPFSTIEKTEREEQFEAKTVNDFNDASLVLNFDPNLKNNFGVLADDVRILTADSINCTESTDEYVIQNPSADMKAGDKIFISCSDNEALFKISSLKKSGNTWTIQSAQAEDTQYGFALEDFYQYLKVDMDVEIDENGVTQSSEASEEAELSADEMAELMGLNVKNVYHDVSGEASLKTSPITFETTHFEITGEVGGKVKASLVIQWDVIIFGKDYFRCDLETNNSFNLKVSMNGKWGTDNNKELQEILKNLEEQKELKLGKLIIPFGVTGFDAYTDLKLMVKWKLTAGAELTGTVENTGGFKYNNKDGYQKVDKKKSSWSVNIKGHAEISLGPTASVGVEFLNGAVSAGVECFIGGKAEGDAVIPVAQWGDERHACHLCVEGELKAVIEVDAKLKYKITEHFKGTPIDLNIVTVEYKLFDFYTSLSNEADSMFGGHMKAGTGSCPNKEYKVTFKAENQNGESVSTSIELITQATGKTRTTVNAGDSVYLPPASYTAKATIDGSACQKTFNVSDQAVTVTLSPSSAQSDGQLNGNVQDAVSHDPIKGAKVEVISYTTLVGTAETDANGNYSIPLPEGSYQLKITADQYITANQYFSIKGGENKYLDSMLMAGDDKDNIMGGIYGVIYDGITGKPLSDVDILVSSGWGNEDVTGTYVAAKNTNSYGEYNLKKWSILGVDFGINAGNYTITIKKDGYITTSFNVTVVGGEDLEFNSTLTPVGAENVYRIVLTWGDTPSDLDSHFNGSYIEVDSDTGRVTEQDHIYYHRKTGYSAYLDVDDTSSYGPETITVPDITKYDGNIYYSVHDYSNRSSSSSAEMSGSFATVKVYKGADLIETFNIPTGQPGTVWDVFYIDDKGKIVPVNKFSFVNEPENVAGSM